MGNVLDAGHPPDDKVEEDPYGHQPATIQFLFRCTCRGMRSGVKLKSQVEFSMMFPISLLRYPDHKFMLAYSKIRLLLYQAPKLPKIQGLSEEESKTEDYDDDAVCRRRTQ